MKKIFDIKYKGENIHVQKLRCNYEATVFGQTVAYDPNKEKTIRLAKRTVRDRL